MKHVATGYPDIMAAYHTLPRFREWLIEDLMERNYQDVSLDQRDAPDRHSKDADVPEWAKGAPPTPKPQYVRWSVKGPIERQNPAPAVSAAGHSEPEQDGADTPVPPEREAIPGPTGAGAPEQPENDDTIPVEPDFAPMAEQYWDLRAQHPDKLVGVQVGEFMMFYGKDAEEASAALGTKALVLDIPGLGQTPATGSRDAWQAVLKKMCIRDSAYGIEWAEFPPPMKRHQRRSVSAIRYLRDYELNGEISLHRPMKQPYIWPSQFFDATQSFLGYMDENGYSRDYVRGTTREVHKFLEYLSDCGVQSCKIITISNVMDFIRDQYSHFAVSTLKTTVGKLRTFLKFLSINEQI